MVATSTLHGVNIDGANVARERRATNVQAGMEGHLDVERDLLGGEKQFEL